MIINSPPFLLSDFPYIGNLLTYSIANGFIHNVFGGSFEQHSVLTKGFSPSNALITSAYNFVFNIPYDQVGYGVVQYGLINCSNNDVNNPNDFIYLELTATKQLPYVIDATNPLAIDVRIISKNYGIIYQFPTYYDIHIAFNDVGIIFQLSNVINDQCNIEINYIDNHNSKYFTYSSGSFNILNWYQWHMHFDHQNSHIEQQNNYLSMNVATPLILPSINSNVVICQFNIIQNNPLEINLSSIYSNLNINNFLVSTALFQVFLPSILSNMSINYPILSITRMINNYSKIEQLQELGDFFINNEFDLELTENERDFRTDNTLITSILITLGTNLSITQEEKKFYGVDTRNGWYGETLFNYSVGWKGWLIPHLKADQLNQIKKWLLEGFQWLIDSKIVNKIEITVQKIDTERYYFQMRFYKKNDSENYRFVYNWEKKNLELR